jgi:hypothetical protein
VTSNLHALSTQHAIHAWASVSTFALLERRTNLDDETPVVDCVLRLLA